MRRHLTDNDIAEGIAAVAAQGERVTGLAVRALLLQRHGHRGGVGRIYAAVARHRTKTLAPSPGTELHPAQLAALKAKNEDLEAKLALAHERYDADQMTWLRKHDQKNVLIGQLRHELAKFGPILKDHLNTHRELQETRERLTILQQVVERLKTERIMCEHGHSVCLEIAIPSSARTD